MKYPPDEITLRELALIDPTFLENGNKSPLYEFEGIIQTVEKRLLIPSIPQEDIEYMTESILITFDTLRLG